ncbi:hypothetical protein BTHE68_72080 (plasmid) [Burkholderia sp. THE68]|uniref:hypothetical protein n=1 Tax=Burkholderia sp. THE68 TaxID=758782 RepID=UPI001317CBA7|nr:hypothetical protein [Burkholderia sp. THE68]BBU33474.1 hypothetical protein BTHE68_72080 [Burkholderia sp. THE68]
MNASKPPGLEPRRFDDFRQELFARARAWLPAWGFADDEGDFGRALLEVAARLNAEVAERLDRGGDKLFRAFLDWLGVRGGAARPARAPVVFRLAETALEPVKAPPPVRMQTDVQDATVIFETQADVCILPGGIETIIAVDPSADAFYVSPPSLIDPQPRAPSPDRWHLKSFAGPGSATLQLNPSATGLEAGTIIAIGGAQYRITAAKDDLASIDPPLPPGGGLAERTPVARVDAFAPFDQARNEQAHLLYLGHADLLNIDAAAVIDVVGAQTLGAGVSWEIWSKARPESETPATTSEAAIDEGASGSADAAAKPDWRALKPAATQRNDALVLLKPAGEVVSRQVGAAQARWIRARVAHLDGGRPSLTTSGIALRINATVQEAATGKPPSADAPGGKPQVEVMVNSTPDTPRGFYPLGRTPRIFDTLYVGCAEAFSKKRGVAYVKFDLADANFVALGATEVTAIGTVLAGVDKAAALHLFAADVDASADRPSVVPLHEPVAPPAPAQRVGEPAKSFAPVLWAAAGVLHVAMAVRDQVFVWNETQPGMLADRPIRSATPTRNWTVLGAPPGGSAPESSISGLAALADTNPLDRSQGVEIVVLREGILHKSPLAQNAGWTPLVLDKRKLDLSVLVPVRHEVPGKLSGRALVIAAEAGTFSLYSVDANGTLDKLLDSVSNDVAPFAIEREDGKLWAVAAGHDGSSLLARSPDRSETTAPLPANFDLSGCSLDGALVNDQLIVRGVIRSSSNSKAAAMLTWRPVDPDLEKLVFVSACDAAAGMPSGRAVVAGDSLLTPGAKEAEVLAARFTGKLVTRSAKLQEFSSALAVTLPAPRLKVGDTIARKPAHGTESSKVVDDVAAEGRGASAGKGFFLLDKAFPADAVGETLLLVGTESKQAFTGKVVGKSTRKLRLDTRDNDSLETPAWLHITDGGSNSTTPAVFEVDSFKGRVAVMKENLPIPTAGAELAYWRAEPIAASLHPALHFDADNADWPLAALTRGAFYFPGLAPTRQTVSALAADAAQPPRPRWIALDAPWETRPNDANVPFVVDATLSEWTRVLSDTSSNPALSWEYWNGTGWWRLPLGDDGDATHNLRNPGVVRFVIPDDLAPLVWSGRINHWIRARLVGGDFGEETVAVLTRPAPDGNGTVQIVQRTTEGVRAPFALDVSVTYEVTRAVLPSYLLTQDSGGLRDQSGANRSQDAAVDIFTPLVYTLRQLAGPASPSGDACANDIGSDGDAAQTMLRADARANRRALFLGVSSKLAGEPVNILMRVEDERPHEAFAPLGFDTFAAGRVTPLIALDETRALSESGIVSMAFDVTPTPIDLFGHSLSWVRLTPAIAGDGWRPSLRGAYLNAAWAQAAETLTRELIGSSDGAPNLTLRLARPPLLHDTLELRVREPLGEEERDALLRGGALRVLRDVPDLPGDWVLWTQVADPADRDAHARVYALDEDTGTIIFGDGLHGMIPPIGEGVIVAFAYRRTEPAVGGVVPANQVAAGAPLNLVTPVENVEFAIAADQAAGGVAPEDVTRVLRFGAARLRHRGRALTARDFQDLALEWFPDIAQALCLIEHGHVRLVVVMRGVAFVPARARVRELRRALLEVAPAWLGAPNALSIEAPVPRRLRVRLALRAGTLDVAGSIATWVKDALRKRFDPAVDGACRWPLGVRPGEDDIAGMLLDAPDLQGIVTIALSEVIEGGGEAPWPAQLAPDELALLADDGVRIAFDIVEAVE